LKDVPIFKLDLGLDIFSSKTKPIFDATIAIESSLFFIGLKIVPTSTRNADFEFSYNLE